MTDQGKKYLSDILSAIDLIEEFIASVDNFNQYVEDSKTQSAVERQLGIIGEAVNQFDKLYPEDSLDHAKKIVGFRNRLIHDYDAVDTSMVWAIIKRHLEPLKFEVKVRLSN